MLQGNPVLNLQYDSDLRVAQQTRVDPPVYLEQTSIVSQPRRSSEDSNDQATIPVSTVQFGVPRNINNFIPLNGLDYMIGLPSIHIEQTFELNDALTSVSSENRFTIRTQTGEAIYSASETSKPKDRMLWGSARPFTMRILDKGNREVLTLQRKLSCCGKLICAPHSVRVWVPPGDPMGRIKEVISFFSTEFIVENANGDIIYTIDGPPKLFSSCCMPKEISLKILSADGLHQKGSISRIWNTDISAYTINIYFADPELNVKMKALFIAAGILFEYMFFQSACW